MPGKCYYVSYRFYSDDFLKLARSYSITSGGGIPRVYGRKIFENMPERENIAKIIMILNSLLTAALKIKGVKVDIIPPMKQIKLVPTILTWLG